MAKFLSLFTNEYDLAKAVRKQDPKAQTTLYEKFASKMLVVCMRYVGDRTEAEDVMIEGFMKVFEKIGQFNFEGSFEGWIRKIMVNESLMYLRSKKNIHVDIEDAVGIFAEDYAIPSLEANDLLKLIATLPDGYRAIFNLYAIEGYSHQEIATMLGISEGTSKSQLSRARSLLQNKLKELDRTLMGSL